MVEIEGDASSIVSANTCSMNIKKEKIVAIIHKEDQDICDNTIKELQDSQYKQRVNYVTEIEVE